MFHSIRTILVPIDFSPLSDCAFAFALQLAERCSAYIQLLHVMEHINHYSLSSTNQILHDLLDDPYVLEQIENANRQLIDLARSNTNPTIKVQQVVLIGNPADLILETVREYRIDLVVIGATRASWLDRLLIGSTTERVIQNATCPVITLKCELENIVGLRHIVFAFDPDEDQAKVVAELKKLQALLDARLHVLLVNTPNVFKTSQESNDQLRQFAETHKLENYDTHVYYEVGVEEGLFSFAKEINADMLAFATHHQNRLLRVLSSRSEQNIINHAPWPLWTFNPAIVAAKSEAGANDYDCVL